MSEKVTGHIITSIFDVLSIAAIFWVYVEHTQTMASISSAADIVSYNTKIYWALGMILVPIVHIIAIIDNLWPKFFSKNVNKPATVIIIVLMVGFFVLPFIMSNKIENKLAIKGYFYCDEASYHGTISSTRVFVKKNNLCTEELKLW